MNTRTLGIIQTVIACLAAVATGLSSYLGELSGRPAVICGAIIAVIYGIQRAWVKAGDDLKRPWTTREFWLTAITAVATVAAACVGFVPVSWAAVAASIEVMAVGIVTVLPLKVRR